MSVLGLIFTVYFFVLYTLSTFLFVFVGSQSVEYKNKVWHEDCFKCFECRQPIRTQSFLTKGDDIYCTSCHEKKFANKCFHCKQVTQNGLHNELQSRN